MSFSKEEEETLKLLWPSGASDADRRLLLLMVAEKREAAFRRLRVLAAVESGQMQVGEAGEALGLGRTGFHKLRKKWGAARSVASITSRAGGVQRKSRVDSSEAEAIVGGEASADNEISRMAWELTRANSKASNGAIGRLLVERSDGAVTLPTASKIIQRLRRAASLQNDYLKQAYGDQLLLDISALGLLIEHEAEVEPAIGVFLVERASGLILAASAGMRRDVSERQKAALQKALDFIEHRRADRSGRSASKLVVVLAEGAQDAAMLATILGNEFVVDSGDRRFGQRLVSMLGHRIGGIELRPRATPLGRELPPIKNRLMMSPVSSELANEFLGDHVQRHNDPIEKRLVEAELIGPHGKREGRMSRAIQKVATAL